MSSTLQSTFVPPHDVTTGIANHHHMHMSYDYDLAMLLAQDTVSPLSNHFGNDIDDLLFQDSPSLDSSSNYSMTEGIPSIEFMNHDEPLLALHDHYVGYNNHPACSYDQFGDSSFGVGSYQLCDSGDVANVYSTYQNNVFPNKYDAIAPPNTSEFQGRRIPSNCGSENSSTTKVGRYSVEERRVRILRYLNKRNQRNFRKTIKYACRKTLADRRVRVRGRFAKNQEEESHSNNSRVDQVKTEVLPFPDLIRFYSDQDYWVHQAMETLTHASVEAGQQAC